MTPIGYSLRQRNIIILCLIILLAVVISLGLRIIVSGLLAAIMIYLIFRPVNIYLQEKRKWNKSLATTVILIASFLVIVLPIFALVMMIVGRVQYYAQNPEVIQDLLKNVNEFAAEKFNEPNLTQTIVDEIKVGAGGAATSVLGSAANTFIQLVVMYFTLFFIVRNFRQFEQGLVQYLPFRPANSKRLGRELKNMTYSNVLGQACIAIIQGTLVGIGFWIFGIANPGFWGLIATFLSMIPMFGSPIVFTPAGIIELSNGNTVAGIGIMIYGYFLVTTVDNFIRMALGKKIADTHPLITIIGVVIGIPLFGMLGILYGPFILSAFLILLDIYNQNRREMALQEGIEEEVE
jgi:predicted PurR-regulated permease PerM